jgi:di/tricarboxylate transporter
MMIAGPGNYRGPDFLRVGLPLTVLMTTLLLGVVNLLYR